MRTATPNARRRALGSYYTPDWAAQWIVARTLIHCESLASSWRILDPACGDGAFILAVLNWIARKLDVGNGDFTRRREIVRGSVFGVDADPVAIESLRLRVADWIGGDVTDLETESILAANFRCGDALLGPDWSPSARNGPSAETLLRAKNTVEPLDWRGVFPQVAVAGGFDVVIGNPPYRRELNAKDDFDRIAQSDLGQRWRTARMDLWHYFLHRGLDLLKPGGQLSFIVNSYWTSSTAARPMRQRLAAETIVEELVLLGPARLFREVSGRHMVFRIRKGVDPQATCQVLDLSQLSAEQIEETFVRPIEPTLVVRTVRQHDLWAGSVLQTEPLEHRQANRDGRLLGETFDVRQGIAENPPFVTRSAAKELGDESLAGQGVFVLTADEVASLSLNHQEQSLLRPYYALSTIGRFRVAEQPSHQLLYLTRRTAPDLTDQPRIAGHLERFRPILQRRREVRSGQIAWWHLHWPREERLFTVPRILCHQMGSEPRFAYAEVPTYVGFSMHLIVARAAGEVAPASLPALTAILNSAAARRWFESHAKRRGAHLDISGTVLKQFPLPIDPSPDALAELQRIAVNWTPSAASEAELNRLVNAIYPDGL